MNSNTASDDPAGYVTEPSVRQSGPRTPQAAVVDALATVEGVDPLELDVALQDAIDGDAVEALAAHAADDWRLTFDVGDHEVTVDGDGTVTVDDRVFPGSFAVR